MYVLYIYNIQLYPVFRSIRPTFASPPRKSQASGSMLRPQETPAEAEAPAEPASESTGFSGSMGSIGSIGSMGPPLWAGLEPENGRFCNSSHKTS